MTDIQMVLKEICEISIEYRRQVKAKGYFDTPGGIENTQDAFDYINGWADIIIAAPRVPVIDGLDEAIEKFKHFVLTGESGGAAMTYPIEKAISAYAELQKED